MSSIEDQIKKVEDDLKEVKEKINKLEQEAINKNDPSFISRVERQEAYLKELLDQKTKLIDQQNKQLDIELLRLQIESGSLSKRNSPSLSSNRSSNRSSNYSQNTGSGSNGSFKKIKLQEFQSQIVISDVSNKTTEITCSNCPVPNMYSHLKNKGLVIYENSDIDNIGHVFPFKTEFNEYPTFFYPYEPTGDKHLDEPKATPFMFHYLKDVLRLDEIADGNYTIHDVHSQKLIFGEIIKGETDLIIAPKGVEQRELTSNICVGFELKTPFTIHLDDSKRQVILEYIAALESRSRDKNLPILFVLTDLYTFKFVWMADEKEQIIRVFETRDLRYAVKLIQRFLIEQNRAPAQLNVTMTNNDDSNKSSLPNGSDQNIYQDVVVDYAYNALLATHNGKIQEINKKSATKSVYRVTIKDKSCVIKLTPNNVGNGLLSCLENEHKVYYHLAKLRNEIGYHVRLSYFPELYFAGTIGGTNYKDYYAIVTRYIEGSEPSWNNMLDSKLCIRQLRKFNFSGVKHQDARTANFVMVKEELIDKKTNEVVGIQKIPVVLDFGLSEICYIKSEEFLIKD